MQRTPPPPARQQKPRPGLTVLFGLLSLFTAVSIGGCSDMILFHPKGPIGETEKFVIVIAFALMLIVVIPVIVMAFWFPWKYRSANPKAVYTPRWSTSGRIESIVWLIPVLIVTALGILTWKTTHRLDPYKPIGSTVKPINIEAVSLDWKWLFIYPDQHIAVVNQLVFPARVPVSFRITSDSVMSSFFIPQLGSQIYAMAGMQTRLHLLAAQPGIYAGQNQQFSGAGYAFMHFEALALSPEQFEAWVQKARNSANSLDWARYAALKQPTSGYPVTTFSLAAPDLFDTIIGAYHHSVPAEADTLHREAEH